MASEGFVMTPPFLVATSPGGRSTQTYGHVSNEQVLVVGGISGIIRPYATQLFNVI